MPMSKVCMIPKPVLFTINAKPLQETVGAPPTKKMDLPSPVVQQGALRAKPSKRKKKTRVKFACEGLSRPAVILKKPIRVR